MLAAIKRGAWTIVGLISVSVAFIGVFLPLVPTTSPLLLAGYCFARGSPRLHRWLHEHPRFGPPLSMWVKHRAINRRAKVTAVTAMAAAIALTILLQAPWWIPVLQLVILTPLATYLATRPEAPTLRLLPNSLQPGSTNRR